MNRFTVLCLGIVLGVSILAIAARRAESGAADAIVRLQQTTPGVQQVGHANLSGTLRAGQLVGSGGGITGVNADLLDGFNSTAFLQSVPVPLNLSGSNVDTILSVTNNSGSVGSSAIRGVANSGSGMVAGDFRTNSSMGTAVNGEATSNGVGLAIGGSFVSASTSGRGVYGVANSTTGPNYGGYFYSSSTSGRGVLGTCTAATGTIYGVYGVASSAASGYAVFAAGDMGASGVKPFRIDHPADPENKYLLHYAAESPFPQNFYNGNVTTDAKGYAWVQLPEYFDEINSEFKYQLTVVDDFDAPDFVQVKVSKKIVANRFQIRSSKPNTEISWRVDANRDDRYVRFKKPKDVVEKEGIERGTYSMPELYGMPANRGLDFDPAVQPRR